MTDQTSKALLVDKRYGADALRADLASDSILAAIPKYAELWNPAETSSRNVPIHRTHLCREKLTQICKRRPEVSPVEDDQVIAQSWQ